MSVMTRAAIAAAAVAVVACSSKSGGSDPSTPGSLNERPSFVFGAIDSKTYNGTTDDLLTAGLGKAGLQGAAPAVATPTNPTVAELRRVAIYNNYRALVDVATNGGFGTLYGPNVTAEGTVTSGDGKIAGEEHIAFADDGSGRKKVTMMVQIPSTFSTSAPCIVAAPSSGSRGVYGAIGTAGEWGLKRGCAVAYTDKGSGNGAHDLAANGVNVMLGTRFEATAAGSNSQFTANLTAAELAAYNGAFPNRWAYKHAHSQLNPEADWGRDTLQAIEFAFYIINERLGQSSGTQRLRTFVPSNTLVIASSVSNGGGASIAAAELDTRGLIDGVAVAEPQIVMNPPSVTIKRGANTVPSFARPLYDYFTLANLLQPCASLAPAAAGSPGLAFVPAALAANRCAVLAERGLVTGSDPVAQGTDALNRLMQAGWEADSIPFQASHYAFATLSVTLTYANAFAKASVKDNLCGYSFGATPVNGVPPPLAAAATAQIFGTGNGVPPTSGINIINNNSAAGAAVDAASLTPGAGNALSANFNTTGALCLRDLYTGTGATSVTVRSSIDAIKRSGNLHGKPAVIVHGRSDTLVPVNHTSRPYYALNKTVEPSSPLAYYEVTNAQHFDAFIDNAALPGYDSRVVPLHRYFNQAMDLMWNHLRNGTPLPPSQVVRTTPRGGTPGAAPAITAANVPPISANPGADAITFSGSTLTIPE